MQNQNVSPTADREIVTERVVSAPQKLVFEAWTKPEHLINWWGPNGFTNTFQETNMVVGGRWKFTMHGPDGKNYPNEIVYHEITPHSKLRYGHSGPDDPDGINFQTTVTFDDVGGGKTKVRMAGLFPTKEMMELVIRERGAIEGGRQTMAKMGEYVEQLRQ